MIGVFWKRTKIKKFFLLIWLFCFSFRSLAIETITINRGHVDPIPIALNKFNADNQDTSRIGEDILQIITQDLKHCGIFKPVSPAAFIENLKGIDHKPLFATWRQINAGLLLNADIKSLGPDRMEVSFILWDTVLEKPIIAETLETSKNLKRRVAHKIADRIYYKTTGDKGYFDTQIAYISESWSDNKKSNLKKIKRLALMDYDGANHRYLTDGRDLVLTPRFSYDNKKILYISYARKVPRVYMKDLSTGYTKIVGDFSGMSFAPRFSRDGRRALMSIARNGSTHIFSIDLSNMIIKQLTFGAGINTSPSYSPDDSKIVFNSDRGGSRQLYVMDADGSNVNRISFSGYAYASPCWSPRGDYIAFTKISPGEGFSIGVMKPIANPEENRERIIANGFLVEGPTWASNGRSIMYSKTEPGFKKTKIYSIDITGYNEKIVPTPKDASDPEWSNPL
jgi:TolB protein